MQVKGSAFLLLCHAIVLTHELCRVILVPQAQHISDGGNRLSGVFYKESLWDKDIITVSFINGDESQRAIVRSVAKEWTPHSNIHFCFVSQPYEGDIRVSFYPNLGSWSIPGMGSKSYSIDTNTNEGGSFHGKQGPSMNFYKIQRSTILHEFGHALGLKHEHQNPYGGIKWNKTALVEYYKYQWSLPKIEHNIIDKAKEDQTNGVYDPDSIMHYEIEPELTMHKCCGRNATYELSRGDKRTISKLYERFKPSRDAADWAVKWNGIGKSNNRAHGYGKSWRGTGISQTQKAALISKILCQPTSEVYAGLLSRPSPKVSAYGTCMVGIVRGMPTFWVQGMYGAVGHSGYPKNPASKDGTGHLQGCYNEHKLTGLCFYSNVAERAKQTLRYAIENDVCTDYPNL